MPFFARIDAIGQIDRIADLPERPDPNPTKGFKWLPVEKTPAPSHNDLLETVFATPIVGSDKVTYQWSTTPRSLGEQQAAVKAHARKRILRRFPEWKQTNMTARGVELQDVWRRSEAWTEGEEAEAAALQSAWEWIKGVRTTSDLVEVMEPIPRDFEDDKYWPER